MPASQVNIYQEENGEVPLLDWLDTLSKKIQDKFTQRLGLLEEKGYDLRRPMADLLMDGIYELRVDQKHLHYRVLYGFVGQNIIMLSHGCMKIRRVPEKQIDLAIKNLKKYKENPKLHKYEG